MTLGSSLASFAAYTLLLQHLGASARVDMLFYAASVPMAVAGMMSGVLLYLLPPRLTQIDSGKQLAVATILGAVFIGLTGTSAAVALTAAHALNTGLFGWLLVGFILTGGLSILSTIAICVAQARGAYLESGIAPLVASSGLLSGALAAIWWRQEWLLLAGQLAGTGLSLWLVARGFGFGASTRVPRIWQVGAASLAPLRRHALSITMGTLAFSFFQPIDAALCSRLDSGSLTVMAYSLRVIVATGTAISLGAFAIAARVSHDTYLAGGLPALRRMANLEVMRIIALGFTVWLIYIVGGDALLIGLFSASNMPAANVERLRSCLEIMLLAAGPMTAVPYLFRLFYSLADYHKPALIGVCVPLLYGGVAWLLLPGHQILALAYSFTLVWWLAFAASLAWIHLSGPQTGAFANSDKAIT